MGGSSDATSRSIPPYVRNAQRGDSCFLSIITLLKNCGADVFWRLTGFWANSAGFDSADSSRTCALADSFFVMPISLQGWRAIFHWYSLVTSDNLIITLLTEGKMYEKHCTMARVAARGVA